MALCCPADQRAVFHQSCRLIAYWSGRVVRPCRGRAFQLSTMYYDLVNAIDA